MIRGDQGRAAVELIDDLIDRLLSLLRRCVRRKQPSDAQMRLGAHRFRNEQIGRFLNAVVDEVVRVFPPLQQVSANRLVQQRVNLRLCCAGDQGQRSGRGGISEARQLLDCLLCCRGQARQLPDHEVHQIVGVTLGVNPTEIPGPARRIVIEGEHSLFRERRNEPIGEERIATCFLMHQLRERRDPLCLAAKSIRDQLSEMFSGEGGKRELHHLPTGSLDRLELLLERMRRRDFVVPVRADQHQVRHAGWSQQIFEEIERRRVEPLQIVEEECQRMVPLGEYADEPPEHHLETPSRVLRRELGNRRLLSDDDLKLRDQVDHEPPIRAQRLRQSVTPATQLGVALAEKVPNEALKPLRQRRIRDVALVLVELPRRKQSARRHEHLMKLVDHR